MSEPVARCRCGYALLRDQDCPECGRTFDLAGPLESSPWKLLRYYVIALTLLSLVLIVWPLIALWIDWLAGTHRQFSIVIIGAFSWFAAGMAALFSLGLAIQSLRGEGAARLTLICLVLDVLLVIPPALIWVSRFVS